MLWDASLDSSVLEKRKWLMHSVEVVVRRVLFALIGVLSITTALSVFLPLDSSGEKLTCISQNGTSDLSTVEKNFVESVCWYNISLQWHSRGETWNETLHDVQGYSILASSITVLILGFSYYLAYSFYDSFVDSIGEWYESLKKTPPNAVKTVENSSEENHEFLPDLSLKWSHVSRVGKHGVYTDTAWIIANVAVVISIWVTYAEAPVVLPNDVLCHVLDSLSSVVINGSYVCVVERALYNRVFVTAIIASIFVAVAMVVAGVRIHKRYNPLRKDQAELMLYFQQLENPDYPNERVSGEIRQRLLELHEELKSKVPLLGTRVYENNARCKNWKEDHETFRSLLGLYRQASTSPVPSIVMFVWTVECRCSGKEQNPQRPDFDAIRSECISKEIYTRLSEGFDEWCAEQVKAPVAEQNGKVGLSHNFVYAWFCGRVDPTGAVPIGGMDASMRTVKEKEFLGVLQKSVISNLPCCGNEIACPAFDSIGRIASDKVRNFLMANGREFARTMEGFSSLKVTDSLFYRFELSDEGNNYVLSVSTFVKQINEIVKSDDLNDEGYRAEVGALMEETVKSPETCHLLDFVIRWWKRMKRDRDFRGKGVQGTNIGPFVRAVEYIVGDKETSNRFHEGDKDIVEIICHMGSKIRTFWDSVFEKFPYFENSFEALQVEQTLSACELQFDKDLSDQIERGRTVTNGGQN